MSAPRRTLHDVVARRRAVPLGATLVHRQLTTPFGPMQLSASVSGLASARFLRASESPASSSSSLSSVAAESGERARAGELLDQAVAEFGEYFGGRNVAFEVALDLGAPVGFARDVLVAAQRIPYGRVATYGEVAAWAGVPGAARAAGNALNRNPVCVIVPCHRVVPSGGGLGGFASGTDLKAHLLRLEGVSLV